MLVDMRGIGKTRRQMEERGAYDTVFIVGTGAEEGAWRPVIAAINHVLRRISPMRLRDGDCVLANCILAEHVHRRRMFHSPIYAQHSADPGKVETLKATIDQLDRTLKGAIRSWLMAAVNAGDVQLRPRFEKVLRQGQWGRMVFLTTNWDHSLPLFLGSLAASKEAGNGPLAFPIHGACWPDSLVPEGLPLPMLLPSETHHDPQNSTPELVSAFRTAGRIFLSLLQSAKHVCLYGLSLDPLDAQLSNLLRSALAGRSCPISIFNLASEEEHLVRRVRYLVEPSSTVQFEAVD
jgi:hypothetical protein